MERAAPVFVSCRAGSVVLCRLVVIEADRCLSPGEQRVADLISNAPPSRALNGPYMLNKQTVFDDNVANVLAGGGGLDWFFAGKGPRRR